MGRPRHTRIVTYLVAGLAAVQLLALAGHAALSRARRWNAPTQDAAVAHPPSGTRPDSTGLLRGRGVGSRDGGRGNMGGGSGRSANTGIGLGGIGASQGARN